MERKRIKIKIKASMVGSSDLTRLKSARALLVENHKKNAAFFLTIKETVKKEEPTTVTTVVISDEYLVEKFSKVKVISRWYPTKLFFGKLTVMFKSNYQFK